MRRTGTAMEHNNAAERRMIPTGWLIAVFLLLLLISAAVLLWHHHAAQDAQIVQIYADGALVREIALDTLTAPQTVEVNGCVILVEADGVSMQSATCPNQLCVQQGKIHNGVTPIVCLPNRVMVTLCGKTRTPDAVIG